MRLRRSQRIFTLSFTLLALAVLIFPQQAKKPVRITTTDPAVRLQAYEKHVEMKAASKFKDLKWQFLGPKNQSGRCTDVAVASPKGKTYTMYVATASGGAWKTTNEGTTWVPVFDQGPSMSIGDIALDPSNAEKVWLGTGEANIFRSSQSGAGVYQSSDGGRTWKHMGLAGTGTVARIVVHPKNPDVVYVAAGGTEWTQDPDRGVFKTSDGGKTWDKVLFVDNETGAYDLVMDPQNNDTVYAAVWQRTRKKWNDPRNTAASAGSGIWKTTDGGKIWTPINNGLPEAKFRGRIGFDLCATKPNVLYALVDNYEKSRDPSQEEMSNSYGLPSAGIIKGATIYRSDDAGATWVQTSGLAPEQKKYMERHSNTYGWVFGQIRVDPNDENTVYTMGLSLHVSRDGGKTFARLRTHGSDHHALWIDPQNSNYLINGFDQGLNVSYDKGLTWRYFQDVLPVSQFFNLNYDMDTPFRVYGSMQDHGSFRAKVDLSKGRDKIEPQEFETAPGGEGSNHAIDPTNPNIVYSAGFYGTLERSEYGKPGPFPGYPDSKTILPAQYEDEPRLRGQWLAPFLISSHNPNIIYHGMQFVFRSLDRGDTWEKISPDLTAVVPSEQGDIPYHTLFALSESPLKYGLLYAGTDDGNVWVTKDGGRKWTAINAGLPYQKWVSRLVASQYKMATVYMTQNGKRDDDVTPYVWKSDDYGKTWVDISKGIPLGPVNVIREDPVDPKILYVGTDQAVYVTTDGGAAWNVLGGNLPSTYVHDLIIHPRDNIIVIATHGRGMWALDGNAVNEKDKRRPWFFYEED
ncbi:MAG: hypothetical protein NTW38_05940 [Candidatus Aminicenantes bacterium]|nr:hypothetical protein [Candidatus Aminicenantes bacterium]